MKGEFSVGADKNASVLKCFSAYLWCRKEHEILTKILLGEVYSEVIEQKDGAYPVDIAALDSATSLYKAIQEGIRGSQDYPQGGLALTQQERANLQRDVQHYATLYVDAYVVATQCSLLEGVPAALTAADGKVAQPAGVFTDETFARLQQETDGAIFVCHDNYTRNGGFGLQFEIPQVPGAKPTNYRSLQRDSARCYLLLLLVAVKAYIGRAGEHLQKGSFKAPEVAQYLIDKLQKLKFGVGMLQPNDIHVDQMYITLRGALKYGQPVLEAAGILGDFKYITEFLQVPANRGKALDASKLSAAAKAIPDYNSGNQAELMLPQDYVAVTKALRERHPDEWAQYRTFAKIFSKADSQAATPGSATRPRRDTEMAESPARRGGKDQAIEDQDDPLAFNLCERQE